MAPIWTVFSVRDEAGEAGGLGAEGERRKLLGMVAKMGEGVCLETCKGSRPDRGLS